MVEVKIRGFGKYVPKKVIPNSFFVRQNPLFQYSADGERVGKGIETSEDWIVKRTGIVERRWAEGLQVHDMASLAIEQALERSPFISKDLTGIVVASVTQEGNFPSAASKVKEIIKARGASDCYDVLAACAGFPVAVDKVYTQMQKSGGVYAVVGVEKLSAITDLKDMNAPLFGDGAGAWILGPAETPGVVATYQRTNTEEGKITWINQDSNGKLRMPNGKEVFKEAVLSLPLVCRKLVSDARWSLEDVDLVFFHQANKRILDVVQKELGLYGSQVFMNIQKYGNTSAASAPICSVEAFEEGRLKSGKKIIMACIGAGMITSGVAAIV
tara:strand:- start:147 stop:1130 length:984 start_codon:yes stop_codon:yes gene_type:complete